MVSSNRELSDVEQTGAARRELDSSERPFDLSGGALCLDFANTLDDRPDPRPNEYLRAYADLLAFARQTGSLSETHLASLLAESARRPAEATAAHARALDLREAIFRLFQGLAVGDQIAEADLAALNRALSAALARARVVAVDADQAGCVVADPAPGHNGDHRPEDGDGRHVPGDAAGRFAWSWADEPLDLEMPLWPIARSAAELLTSPAALPTLRLCASERCAWLFLDTSRNGSRRWCSMRTCGNRAKARRHHARVRAAAARSTEQ